MSQLVLSLFPGIGLLDMAFELEGFCVVRGPDLLWGGDIKTFHPPAGKFDGVIGGPPCQVFSALRAMEPNAGIKTGNLIPEFERVVSQSQPWWFVMENVPDAPCPEVRGYSTDSELVHHDSIGGDTSRVRRFTLGIFGYHLIQFKVESLALYRQDTEASVLASEIGKGMPSGTRKRYSGHNGYFSRPWETICELQGLPQTYDLPGFRASEKCRAVGNGVPLPMGRAVAKAVKRALGIELGGGETRSP